MDRTVDFSKVGDAIDPPDLTTIQTDSYVRFLQADTAPERRKAEGLEGLLREVFPIVSYDEKVRLEYVSYELGEPRYTPDECRQLRLSYGRPLRLRVRLIRKEAKDVVEESIYLGDLPTMIGGGEFIVNGAERVIVSQLHRSPGVDFTIESKESDRPLHGARIIPERGSWIEMAVNKRDSLCIRIDQSSKFPVTTFMRAMDPDFGTTEAIVREFYETTKVSAAAVKPQMYAVEPIIDPDSGEELVGPGKQLGEAVTRIQTAVKGKIEVVAKADDPLILTTLAEDSAASHDEALLRLYARLRPGNPPQLDKAKTLFTEKFFDENRYRLGKVGRFRLNRKFHQDVDEAVMTLRAQDMINAVRYIMRLRGGEGVVDDIDHLGNRRLRTIDELAADELRKGFLKLRRTVQERMSLREPEELGKISELVNSKAVSSSIEFFFGRSELSQVVDQTNPLSQLTHERRLSALGPGGLNRKRAGFEVRDVHISHYGRICPVETPEGNNIGLISSLGIYATVDEYGFLVTPYRTVARGRVTEEIAFLRADEEMETTLAPPDELEAASSGRSSAKLPSEGMVLARMKGEVSRVATADVLYLDVSPKQTVGVSAALIPFLEHDDANRALMGSNMQRQAVPLIRTEAPIVGTGLERFVARNSGMVVRARQAGTITYLDSGKIVIDSVDEYPLRKFARLNERTCLNQKPIVRVGQRVKKGEILADGPACAQGELALGRNVLVAFVPFDGYNFEDAILISERLVKNDAFTSIHIEEYEVEIRETKLGREEFTRDIPNVSERALRYLDADGIVEVGTRVMAGDILVGKVAPKSKSELTPEEKLLHAIFGRAGEDVKNDSLELPAGEEGVVLSTQRFSRRAQMSDEQKRALTKQMKVYEAEMDARAIEVFRRMCDEINAVTGTPMVDPSTRQKVGQSDIPEVILEQIEGFKVRWIKGKAADRERGEGIYNRYRPMLAGIEREKERKLGHMKRGDELPSGVLETVKVQVVTKRTLSVGDKMAGRHGNKGVIARILPEEDMPFLADGTPVDICLNPLGVPSRMNVGQILETHLGWAAAVLGFKAVTPVFDGAREAEIFDCIRQANEHVRTRTYASRVRQLRGQASKTEPSRGSLEEAKKRLQHVRRFSRASETEYRSLQESKDRDREVREYLRKKYYASPRLVTYGYVEAPGLTKAQLRMVEGSLIQRYLPRFNREGKQASVVGDMSQAVQAVYDKCVAILDGTEEYDWLACPGPAAGLPKTVGLYFFKESRGDRCGYVGIAAGSKGIAQRLQDHFKQNSFGDNLVLRFAEEDVLSLESGEAQRELEGVDQRALAESIGVVQAAGDTKELLVEMPLDGKTRLIDGRTGEPFDQKVTVGYMYLTKLHHLVDDKIHARSTGPYSLITQQPLGGKARTGGQRFGEMEVWALEAYGASYTLQEMLTVKSDDVEGRTKIYESMVKGHNTLEAGTPVSFDVLCNELRGLGLSVQLEKKSLI